MNTYNILAISGSLRKESYNTALLHAFAQQAPNGVSIELADIHPLGLYDQDEEAAFPRAAAELKEKIRKADGIIVATPEYNRSIPGVLKNAIDWTSRPYGDNAWEGKPVYVVGASVGNIGTAVAQYELKKILLYLDAAVLGQPEFFCGMAQTKFVDGKLTEGETKQYVDKTLTAFIGWIDRVRV